MAVNQRLELVRFACLQDALDQKGGRFVVLAETAQKQQNHLAPVSLVQMVLDLTPDGGHTSAHATLLDVTGRQVVLKTEVREGEKRLTPLHQQARPSPGKPYESTRLIARAIRILP